MSLGRFLGRIVAPIARVAAPVVGLFNPAAGAALAAGSSLFGRGSDQPRGLTVPSIPTTVSAPVGNAVAFGAGVLRGMAALPVSGVRNDVKSPTFGQAAPSTFLPLPGGITGSAATRLGGDVQRLSDASQQAARKDTMRARGCTAARGVTVNVTVSNRQETRVPTMSLFRDMIRRPLPRSMSDVLDPTGRIRKAWNSPPSDVRDEKMKAPRVRRRRRRSAAGADTMQGKPAPLRTGGRKARTRTRNGQPSAAQIEARRRFAERARSGEFRRNRNR